jgi:hypothetical protein
MKLDLTPKCTGPDLFELEAEGIRVTSKTRRGFETRSPYGSLSSTYSLRRAPKTNKLEAFAKLAVLSAIPALFLYYSTAVGWPLAILALISAIPLLLMIRRVSRRPFASITFTERADGDFAFYIPFYPEEEPAVLDFVREIQKKIQNETRV